MKGLYTLFIVTLLAVANLSAQTLSRYTTGELLHRLKANTAGSCSNAEDPFNFIRLDKGSIITSTPPVNTLNLLDFETIPGLREKFNSIRKKDNRKMIMYTHLNKELLYLGYTERDKTGFSGNRTFGMSSMYLVEVNSLSAIQPTHFYHKENY